VVAGDREGHVQPVRQDDLLSPTIAKKYRDTVLAPGGSAPAAKLVENFLGRRSTSTPTRRG
jgi:Zn-dependent oligopeptidase